MLQDDTWSGRARLYLYVLFVSTGRIGIVRRWFVRLCFLNSVMVVALAAFLPRLGRELSERLLIDRVYSTPCTDVSGFITML